MRRQVWIWAIAGAIVTAPALAAPQKVPAKKPPAVAAKAAVKPAPQPWKPRPYTGGLGTLPANYKGENALEFAKVFERAAVKAKKDEFETTAAYQARIADVSSLIAPLDTATLYAFQPAMTASYDADTQIFTVRSRSTFDCGAPSLAELSSPTVLCEVATRYEPTETYEGQNAYGASMSVKKIRAEKIAVSLPRALASAPDYFTTFDAIGSFGIEHKIAMPVATASTLRGKSISMLFVGRITGPALVSGRVTSSRPTFKDPVDMFISVNGLPFEPTELVFYVEETGQVLDTVKAEDLVRAGTRSVSPQDDGRRDKIRKR